MDAWTGHRRFVLGLDPDDTPVSRAEATDIDRRLAGWQSTGLWEDDRHG